MADATGQKSWIERLEGIDRRAIFLVMGLAITLPLLFPVPLPINPTSPVKDFYAFVDKLPPGSRVLVSDDWDPGSKAELETISLIVHRHLRDRGIRVISTCLWQTGTAEVEKVLGEIYGRSGKVYGTDYISLGFKEGRELTMASMGNSIPATYPADSRGAPLGQFPIMQGVNRLSDLSALISVSAGYPGTKEWVQQVQKRYNIPMVSACAGVSAPEYFAYYESKQLSGLVGGMKAFAEYEKLLGGQSGFATLAMTSQAAGHYMLVLLILIGNVLYLLKRGMKMSALGLAAVTVVLYAATFYSVWSASGGHP
jgi:hypothetical protein